LRTFPSLRLWQAGCSEGLEAYLLASLLEEEGWGGRYYIYVTDTDKTRLLKAAKGSFPLSILRRHEGDGGRKKIPSGPVYYKIRGANFSFPPKLKRNILFAQHSLATDHSFNEFQAIFCGNALAAGFDAPTRDRARSIFHASLSLFGVLGTGGDSPLFPPNPAYQEMQGIPHLYRRIR
jgi:chemotaxis protein methyltransferase CheR